MPKCSANTTVKNGFLKGKQRVKCKGCGYQFTRLTPQGRPVAEKVLAVLLYMHGLSLNSIARLLNLSTPAVLKWIRKFAMASYEKPEPTTAGIIELDEMRHFLQKKNE